MQKLALTFTEAAKLANVEEYDIINAIKGSALPCRVIRGHKGVVLTSDLQLWLESFPAYEPKEVA